MTKQEQLSQSTAKPHGEFMTTDHGMRINNNQDSLKAGPRGATLLEDFILREKIFHFDHERIPERVVHARGAGAHGVFELTKSLEKYTYAGFLNRVGEKTEVFVRFSTVAGSRGSTDLARDVRGFAIKFYTPEGNYDMVGNNMPVFFIQDAIKFPDLIHAVKPEPHNEIPQAQSAHTTFWDWASLTTESTHMLMWTMSDRAIPRSYRMMEGFGVHSYRFINAQGEAFFVKFHFKPVLGVHSVAWDEAQKISGADPDFHRRDLFEAIENNAFPEWEVGVQIVPQADEHKFDFDLLDSTKLIPEEVVPVEIIGKMTLNRNPVNYFAETEQVAFHLGNIVPGIDFTNDPLLQGRLFSYTDTQLSRLGSTNYFELPINRSLNTVQNNQRDGHMRHQINDSRTAYQPNSLNTDYPIQAKVNQGGFKSYEERVDGYKIRQRSESFNDHFSQAKMFYNSQSEPEKQHIKDAFSFELGKVEVEAIQQRMVRNLTFVDQDLATYVAEKLGIDIPVYTPGEQLNYAIPADNDPQVYQPVFKEPATAASPALSMANTAKDSIKSRVIAVLATDGVDAGQLSEYMDALTAEGAVCRIVAAHGGYIKDSGGNKHKVFAGINTTASVLYDAVFIPGGAPSVKTMNDEADYAHFVNEAYKHCKAIAITAEGKDLLQTTYLDMLSEGDSHDSAFLIDKAPADFIEAIKQHRNWEREQKRKLPA